MQHRIVTTLPFSIDFWASKDKIVRTKLHDSPGVVKIHSESKSMIEQILTWIDSYTMGSEISIFYELGVSEFTQKVLKAIATVPIGEVITYSQLALRAGNEKAVRAVAASCGRNPLPLIIPCHRIVSVSGIGGFAFGVELKEKLIDFERQILLSK